MPNYNTINAHDADCRYPSFLGLNQYGNETSMNDPRFAVDEKNVETFNGVMQPCASNLLLTPTLPAPIETLALLHRRWYVPSGENPDILVAASGGKLYWMLPDGTAWTQVLAAEGDTEDFASNEWSYVTYEINPSANADPVDVLLMSNAVDGMIMVRGDNMTFAPVTTPYKFGIIERYAERIWGGAIADEPDTLAYSVPFDPTDWAQDVDIPEDGGGDIRQPSWDGDSFTALKAFGSQLIAFKRTRVWRVLGTDPGEYTFKEQYGGGAPYAATIAVDTYRILAITDYGPVVYDGNSVTDFNKTYVEKIFERVNRSCMDKACAVLWHGKYYVALPVDGSQINNAVLIYNTVEGSWLFRDDLHVESFLPGEHALYYTSSTTPGQVWLWRENSWDVGECTAAPAKWVTPWNELGYKQIEKGPFDVYLLCEVQTEPVTLYIMIQTEKKTMTREFHVEPITAPYASHKPKKLHFPGYCRRFRLIIESAPESPPWRLLNGIMVVPEIERD